MPPGRFNQSYDQYLVFRNYDPSAGKLLILKRALVDSWAESGFHRFWQVWNPGIGHLLYRFYRLLGGSRRRLVATMAVFLLCGFLHDLAVMLIFRRPFMAFSAAFILFAVLASLNRALELRLGQEGWPRILNAISNIGCLAVSIFIAVQLQKWVFP
jgi:hypothetical protein